MRPSPFTIVYQSELDSEPQLTKSARQKAYEKKPSKLAESDRRLQRLQRVAPKTWKSLRALPPNLSQTLLNSSFPPDDTGKNFQIGLETLKPVIEDLTRSKKKVTAAAWDLGARVDKLVDVITVLNRLQPKFTFFNLQAPVPAGLILPVASYDKWVESRAIKSSGKKPMDNNMIADDFYPFAEAVRKKVGVDYLVGITPYMVAGTYDGDFFWNYFGDVNGRVLIISTYNLREFARRADRPFEVAVAGLMVAHLLVATNKNLDYHEENRGCMFDFNADRVSIIESIRRAEIEPGCLKRINPKYRTAATAMVKALREYKGEPEVGKETLTKQISKSNDKYYLEKLNALAKKLKQ